MKQGQKNIHRLIGNSNPLQKTKEYFMKGSLQNIAEERGVLDQVAVYELDEDGPTARLAVYDSPASTPQVFDFSGHDHEEFINRLATQTYRFSQEAGGLVPFSAIKEVVENLIHADFKEVVITIINNGNTVRVSDQGPGIPNKEKIFEPGFSTATKRAKKVIKGIGSGLFLTRHAISPQNGQIIIEDNLKQGTVVTINIPARRPEAMVEQATDDDNKEVLPSNVHLTDRQKRALFLVTELGEAGPSRIASELDISLSTAYRDLTYLEGLQLIESDKQGKRSLTLNGIRKLDDILHL
jgi:hypothetical protein